MVCLVNIPYIDKNEAAEMFQLLFDTRLFKFTADAPQCNPFSELPPTIARESSKQGTARTPNPLIKMDTLYTSGLCEGESPPQPPPGRYAAGCSQERAAEKAQSPYDTREFKYTAEAPQSNPFAELPPTIA